MTIRRHGRERNAVSLLQAAPPLLSPTSDPRYCRGNNAFRVISRGQKRCANDMGSLTFLGGMLCRDVIGI